MTYGLLGQDLHETAERAKRWFTTHYGASRFRCEESVMDDLPLLPTWQGDLQAGYTLCINVQPTAFSPSLFEFVTRSAQSGLPIKFWVAIPDTTPKDLATDLKKARSVGIGVVQMLESGQAHEYHRAVPLSLFGLKRADLATVAKARREVIKNAEDIFLDGAPDQGCQAVCQELESITRKFAERSYTDGLWKMPAGATPRPSRFFQKKSWSNMLEEMERSVDTAAMIKKCPLYNKQMVVRTRAYTQWRNDVSHKPKSLKQLKARDAKLRGMFEVTRDLLVEWYALAQPLRLLS